MYENGGSVRSVQKHILTITEVAFDSSTNVTCKLRLLSVSLGSYLNRQTEQTRKARRVEDHISIGFCKHCSGLSRKSVGMRGNSC